MKTIQTTLPVGRFLYKPADEIRFVVLRHDRTGELWIVEDGWTAESEAAGPFRPSDVLRAFRLANTIVPEGCELGPWQHGIGLFERCKLPAHPKDWSRVDPAWLEPSLSRYDESDISEVVNETCCAPPQDRPRIDWNAEASTAEARELQALVQTSYPELRLHEAGTLQKAWNAHPAGSPLLAEAKSLHGVFVVVDLPPT